MKACIATIKRPTDFNKFIVDVKAFAANLNCEIKGYVVVGGRGCLNHGIIVEGERKEEFMRDMALILMPAKWGEVDDSDPAVVEGQFEMRED